jgi:N-acetylglucosamine malate deacetylase 1
VLPLANGQEAFITSARIESQGEPVKVLAVGAHPDDLEILCGGTLARYVAESHRVVMCHASRGDRGSFVHTSEEIAQIRDGEAKRAAEIAGAEHVTLGLSDGEVNAADPEQRRLVADLVRQAQPDLIITHSPGDYMVDHNEISKLVFDASFLATLPLYETGRERHALVTPIYFMETIMGLGFTPTEYVDVSAHMETKVAMLEAHQSQLTWLRDHDGVDIVEQMRAAARFRGLQCGVKYAEGFVQCLTWLRGTTRRLLP